MTGLCKNADCLNTKGSYRCTCRPGFMLDPARSHCVCESLFPTFKKENLPGPQCGAMTQCMKYAA